MGKKVLIISTSLRKNGNSDMLARSFAKGAETAGNDVEIVSLADKQIAFCRGCFACQKTGKCIINDDAVQITEKIAEAEVVVWATPIYYYEMAGQMKTLIDRANSLFATGKNFTETYLITTSADTSENVIQTVINGLNGWIACFDNLELKGYVNGAGLEGPNEAAERKDLMEKAYTMGKNI